MTLTDVFDWISVAVLIGFAVWAILDSARRENEYLDELDDHEIVADVPPFRILEPPPYNWQNETE